MGNSNMLFGLSGPGGFLSIAKLEIVIMRNFILQGLGALTCVAFLPGAAVTQENQRIDYSVLPLVFEESTDPEQQQFNFYNFIWRSFIALNWPNEKLVVDTKVFPPRITSGTRGKPDSARPLSAIAKTDVLSVWETYKAPYEVFPPVGRWATSDNWNDVRPPPPPPEGTSTDQVPADSPQNADSRPLLGYPFLEYATDTQQPYFFPHFTGPLYDRNGGLVRYEVAVNRAFFRYVRTFGYYNNEEQIKAVNNYLKGRRDASAFQRPPFGNPAETGPGGYLHPLPDYAQTGLVDLKAAWRVLDPQNTAENERYVKRNIVVGYKKDGKPDSLLMGLVALHILRWTSNGYDPIKGIDGAFVASTFEQIDNVTANIDRHGNLVKPTFNDGELPTPEENEYGFEGKIPKLGDKPVNIYRAEAQRIPPVLQALNKRYQTQAPVSTSPLRYYQLIGTQNRHVGAVSFKTPESRERNGHQGPITGVNTNANNLVNSALESYTQKNFSCILCHVRARPFGVPHKPGQSPVFPERAFEDDHFKILTFLLQSARGPGTRDPGKDAD